MTTPVLRLQGVRRIHGSGRSAAIALDGIDLEVRPGELVAVTGRSGSGKSTLLNVAGGLDVPTSGLVDVAGERLDGLSRREQAELRRRHVGYVFQADNLLPTLTALENIALPLELDGVAVGAARGAAREALAAVLPPEHADRYPDQLSGGEQQRVAIARALVGPRTLLLADEPTGALDEVTAEGVLSLLRARIDEGAAGLMVTHDPAQAAWADRVIRLRDGRIASEVAGGRRATVGASGGPGEVSA